MAKELENIFSPGTDEIAQNFTIESWHVSQSIDAFTGVEAYNINLSGSLAITGSTFLSGSPAATGGGFSTLVIDDTTGQIYTTGSYTNLGPQGPQGPQGPSSNVSGPQGPQGPQGPTSNVSGPQGPLGPQGPQGPQGPGSTPALPFGSVQFNDGGAFGGEAAFTYDSTNNVLTIIGSGTGASNTYANIRLSSSEPTPVRGDVLGIIETSNNGFGGGGFNSNIQFEADGTWSGGNYPTRIAFNTTLGATVATALTLSGSKDAWFGGDVYIPSMDTALAGHFVLLNTGSGELVSTPTSSITLPAGIIAPVVDFEVISGGTASYSDTSNPTIKSLNGGYITLLPSSTPALYLNLQSVTGSDFATNIISIGNGVNSQEVNLIIRLPNIGTNWNGYLTGYQDGTSQSIVQQWATNAAANTIIDLQAAISRKLDSASNTTLVVDLDTTTVVVHCTNIAN